MKIVPHMLQPTTPIRGIEAMPFGFDTPGYRKIVKGWKRTGRWKRFGAKRVSRGFILNGLAYYWCPKGYYRCGKGDRRPIQHILWERRTRKAVPRGHEIWFKDRDRHNFSQDNMELLPKAEVHSRLFHSGEVPRNNAETARKIWDTRGRKNVTTSRSQTALLLQRFAQKENHEHSNIELIGPLVAARDERRRQANSRTGRAWYRRQKKQHAALAAGQS